MKTRIIPFFCLLLSATAHAQEPSPALDRLIDSTLAATKIPALVIAVVRPDRISYGIGGLVRADSTEQITAGSKFHLGSNTKAITSFIAAKLVEQGKLRWTDTLVNVIPELKNKIKPDYARLTLGDLLAHRAGVRPYTSGLEFSILPVFTGSVSDRRSQFAQYVLNQSPAPAGVGGFTYSNAGYAIATIMLERVSGQSWETLVQNTFATLGLPYFVGFPNKQNTHQPWGHLFQNDKSVPQPPTDPYRLADFVAPAGDLAMSVGDYARFVQLHLNGLLGKNNYLTANSYQTLHFNQKGYGYGWANSISTLTNQPISGHDGSAGTFYCHTFVSPSQQLAVVVIANDASSPTQKAIVQLRRTLARP